ncbi:lipoyl synthase [Geobacter sp. SVR]|uniref:lipoyl synthase n=1 Tax=Geobacter sp. SVR TaxID=2495594 RepID=UPI00143EFDF3|nr:lipoyl synthase [Geobacter sp. SVR]BCS54604.1 lipoyl synthase [Geobacter sp. SVR]GCF86889.1 lipoyl synthase [Geobacter sp. SVR]
MNIQRKPEWLQKRVNPGQQAEMRLLLGELRLNTVCQQALCPNISECFSCGQATFLILGKHCTRLCSFCNVEKTTPLPVDSNEPGRVAEAASRLKLSHVVITSPTRDDLADGGAGLYAATVAAIRTASSSTRIELLVPDFQGSRASLETVVAARPDIIAHNVETVPRLYHIRSGADYLRSLEVLRLCAELGPLIGRKSGIMLGMGEEEQEVLQVLGDLRRVGCTFLSIGQYLAPSRRHYPVQEYVHPDRFEKLRLAALALGFAHVESGPYVRSSYHAAEYAAD